MPGERVSGAHRRASRRFLFSDAEGLWPAGSKSPTLATKASRSKVHTRRVFRSRAVATAAVALAAGGGASGQAAAATLPTAAARAPQMSVRVDGITEVPTLETKVLEAINDLRRSRGLKPLRASLPLAAAARQHSLSMAEHGFFDHASLNGLPFWKRVEAKYRPRGGRFWSVGENMAWAARELSARSTLKLWLESPEHRENLFAPAWREIGLGAVYALAAPGVYEGFNVTILTADFGVRR